MNLLTHPPLLVPLASDYGIYDSPGQILALAFRQKALKPFAEFPLCSDAVYRTPSMSS